MSRLDKIEDGADAVRGEPERLLTITQVASYLQLSARTVRRLVAMRQLRCVRLGRSVRFDPADVFRFVAGRRE